MKFSRRRQNKGKGRLEWEEKLNIVAYETPLSGNTAAEL